MKILRRLLLVMLLGVLPNVFGMDGNGVFQPDPPPRQAGAWMIPGLRGATFPRPDLLERMYPRDIKAKRAPKKLRRSANPTRPKQELQCELVVERAVVPDAKEVSEHQPVVTPQTADVANLTANVAQLTLSNETPNHQEVVEPQEDVKKPEQEEPVVKVSFKPLLDGIQAACDEKNAHVQKPDEKVLAIIASHFDGDTAHSQFWNKLKEAMGNTLKSNIVISLEDFGKALCWWFQHKGKHIDQITDKDKRTLLYEQVLRNILRNKKKDLCGFFLAVGASIACRDCAGVSPLMAAVDDREKEIYILFFERFPRKAYEELKELTRRKERDQRKRQSSLLGVEWYEVAWRCYYNTVIAQHLEGIDFTCEEFLKQVKKEIAKDTEYGI